MGHTTQSILFCKSYCWFSSLQTQAWLSLIWSGKQCSSQSLIGKGCLQSTLHCLISRPMDCISRVSPEVHFVQRKEITSKLLWEDQVTSHFEPMLCIVHFLILPSIRNFQPKIKKKKKNLPKKKNLSKCMRLISEDLSRMSPEPKATEWKRKEGFLNGPHLLKTKIYRKRGEKSAVFMSCRQSTSARRECDY